MTGPLRSCGRLAGHAQDEGVDGGHGNLLTRGDSSSSLQLERDGRGTGTAARIKQLGALCLSRVRGKDSLAQLLPPVRRA